MTRNPHARWRTPKPVPLRAWVCDSRGREHVTPKQVVNDHERLHELVESRGYPQPAQVFRVPTVWPHVMG